MGSIIDKVRKLLNKSASAKELGSVKEAEAFAAKAHDLLMQHNLDIKDVAEKPEYKRGECHTMEDNLGGPRWRIALADTLCGHYLCIVMLVRYQGSKTKLQLVGRPDNLEVCEYVYELTRKAFTKAAHEAYKSHVAGLKLTDKQLAVKEKQKKWKADQKAFYASFYKGANYGLWFEMTKHRKQLPQADAIGALVKSEQASIEASIDLPKEKLAPVKKRKNNDAASLQGFITGKNHKLQTGLKAGVQEGRLELN
jgi:hypothetical protein